MKKLLITLVLATITQFAFGQKQVYVNGYYNQYGTYVAPHFRTSPNRTVYDNWSTSPNYNPYTGKQGTKTYSNSYYNNYYYNQPTYPKPSYNYNNYYYSPY
jgi:hypothetical protein